MKLSNALHEFLLEQKIRGNSIQTYETYEKRVGYFIEFITDKEVDQLTLQDYIDYVLYLQSKNLSSQTIKTRLNDVRVFIRFLHRRKYIYSDFDLPTYKAGKKTIVILTENEIDRLLHYFNRGTLLGSRDYLIAILMLDCGLRVSEVLRLEVGDFIINNSVIKILGKGAKERLVPLTTSVVEALNHYMILSGIETGKLFNITTSGVRIAFSKIKKNLHFSRFHPHYLRHTFATWFIINGGDALNLKEILGHETLYMTEVYVHIANQMTIARQSIYSPLTVLQSKRKKA